MNEQIVSLLETDRHDLDDLGVRVNVVENSERTGSKLPLRQSVRPKSLTIARLTGGLVRKLGLNLVNEASLIELPY